MPITLTDLTQLLDRGVTGISVGLFISLLEYFRTTKNDKNNDSLNDFTRWLDNNRHSEIIEGQGVLLEILKSEGKDVDIIKCLVQQIISHMQSFEKQIEEIAHKVELIPSLVGKVDTIIDELSRKDTDSIKKGQVAICSKVLNIITNELVGAGIKVIQDSLASMASEGTIYVCWQLGTKSPNLMILDLIGSIDTNRISLILNEDNSVTLRVYDGVGKSFTKTSVPFPPSEYLVIFAAWNKNIFSLRINGSRQGEFIVDRPLEYLGPFCLFGMDIDCKLSAEEIRWAPPGQPVGLQLYKDGICHDSLLDQIFMWQRCLPEWQMDEFLSDPYLLYLK